MNCRPTITPHEIDIPALRKKYAEERDKRKRSEGTAQYVEIAGDLAGYYEVDPHTPPTARPPVSDDVDVVILGGGFAGLMAGARLKEAGLDNIRIIELGGDFGGTWYWNRYPGIQCDVESYTYLPLLEELNYVPKDRYSYGPEIYEHCRRIGEHFGLYEHALFSTLVRSQRWDESIGRWRIGTNRGDDIRARFVIVASGPFNKPKLPGIPGIRSFKGHSFHTARWDYHYTGGDMNGGLVKLADKRVAVIGTGASAIQCVPFLGQYSRHLYVFQRTPSYVDDRGNRPTDPEWAKTLKPGWQSVRQNAFNANSNEAFDPRRQDIICDGWTEVNRNLSARLAGLGYPKLTPEELAVMAEEEDYRAMERIRRRVDSVVKDKRTAEILKAWYRFRCKRPCFNDDYLPTFNRPNVTLVDVSTSKGVERITEKGIVANGIEYEVDCMVFASGFEITTDVKRRFGIEPFLGRDGLSLYDHWANGFRTFHGLMSHGFPNQFFTGYTQSTVLSAITLMYDHQANHIAYIIKETLARGAATVEPSQEAQDGWVETIREKSVKSEFFKQCTPSYFNSEGTDTVGSPLFGELYGPGYKAFDALLKDWRDKGDLEGLIFEQ